MFSFLRNPFLNGSVDAYVNANKNWNTMFMLSFAEYVICWRFGFNQSRTKNVLGSLLKQAALHQRTKIRLRACVHEFVSFFIPYKSLGMQKQLEAA